MSGTEAAKAAKELKRRKQQNENRQADRREQKYTGKAVGANMGLYGITLGLLKNPLQPNSEGIAEHAADLAEKMGLRATADSANAGKRLHIQVPDWWDLPRNWGPYYDPLEHAVNIPAHSRDAIILHELGHAKNDVVMASKWGGKFHLPYRMLDMISRVGSGATFLPALTAAARQKDSELSYTPGVLHAILSSPMLAEEAAASARATAHLMQEYGTLKGAAHALPLLPAFGTYATIAGAPLLVTYLRKRALEQKQESKKD